MKCLCCGQFFANQQSLKSHYVEFRNVYENNHFLRKLFTRDNVFVPRKCFRCDYFYINRRNEKNYNFLMHYQLSGRQPIEDNPLKKNILWWKSKKVLYKFFRAWNFFIIFIIPERQCQNIWWFLKIIIHLMQTLGNLGLNVLLQL